MSEILLLQCKDRKKSTSGLLLKVPETQRT
jgi:hypothetical protein